MKDCLERKSFRSKSSAEQFAKWYRKMQAEGFSSTFTPIPFECKRCGRWHVAGSRAVAKQSSEKMTKERCLTTRDLHLQLCRVLGISLEELQTRCDLEKIGIGGVGNEWVSLKPKPGEPTYT